MNDQEWELRVERDRQEDWASKQVVVKQGSAALNLCFALLSPACLFFAFYAPSDWSEVLLYSVWCLGTLCSFGVLAVYAYTDKVSHKTKEAALSCMLGNLLVFFVFLLKPT